MLTLTIRPQGYMANQMIQLMFAKTLQTLTQRESKIIHYDAQRFNHPPVSWKDELPEWDITFAHEDLPPGTTEWVRGNDINFNKLIARINNHQVDNLVICGPLVNLRYYYAPEYYRQFFVAPPRHEEQVYQCRDDQIIIHIRGGDIIQGAHRDYFPLPLGYYRYLINKTGLSPVFIGQIGDDVYSTALKKEFSDALFLERKSVVADFETIRRSRHAITSISSFAWLATWLSSSVQNIFCPMAGILNPYQRNDIDLIPRTDPRYHFFRFDRWKFNARKDDFEKILSDGIQYREINVPKIPFFLNRIHRGIHNKFKILIPIKFNQAKHQPLSLISIEQDPSA